MKTLCIQLLTLLPIAAVAAPLPLGPNGRVNLGTVLRCYEATGGVVPGEAGCDADDNGRINDDEIPTLYSISTGQAPGLVSVSPQPARVGALVELEVLNVAPAEAGLQVHLVAPGVVPVELAIEGIDGPTLRARLPLEMPADARLQLHRDGFISNQLRIRVELDGDGDGINDAREVALGLDPDDPSDAAGDLDRDGLTNLEEENAALDARNPADANEDLDGDGLTNRQEIRNGFDLRDPRDGVGVVCQGDRCGRPVVFDSHPARRAGDFPPLRNPAVPGALGGAVHGVRPLLHAGALTFRLSSSGFRHGLEHIPAVVNTEGCEDCCPRCDGFAAVDPLAFELDLVHDSHAVSPADRTRGFLTPVGHGWTHPYHRRLTRVGDTLYLVTGHRLDALAPDPLVPGALIDAAGRYVRVVPQPDGRFILFHRHGSREVFRAPDDPTAPGMVERIESRQGHALAFSYAAGRLATVQDALGRIYTFTSDPVTGLLAEVVDFRRRRVRLAYDARNRLISLTSPPITETPTGNDFPDGLTIRFGYGADDALTAVTWPGNEAPRIRAVYDAAGELTALQVGDGLSAGGTFRYAPAPRGPGAEHWVRTISRTGHRIDHGLDAAGHFAVVRAWKDEARFDDTRYEYNADGERTLEGLPEGNERRFSFDSENIDRSAQGNLVGWTAVADADRGGDQAEIRHQTTYDPVFQRVIRTVDPRGLDPDHQPPGGGVGGPGRYLTSVILDYQEGRDLAALARAKGMPEATLRGVLGELPLGLGDVNGDGLVSQVQGNALTIHYPAVILNGEPRPAVSREYTFSAGGQRLTEVDGEGNVTRTEYHPAADPDGDGIANPGAAQATAEGYIRAIIQDSEQSPKRRREAPAPLAIRQTLRWTPSGALAEVTTGRGVTHRTLHNTLDWPIGQIRAAATAPVAGEPVPLTAFRFERRVHYDARGNVVRRQTEDRGNTRDLGIEAGHAWADVTIAYDMLDRPIAVVQEVGGGDFTTARVAYDADERPVIEVKPVGNAVARTFDGKGRLHTVTAAAPAAPPGALLPADFPADLTPRGGEPATVTFHYDGNNNLIVMEDAADTDGSPANNGPGGGDRSRRFYDGHDRLQSAIDAVGSQTVLRYDAAGRVVSAMQFGPTGGPSPRVDGLPAGPAVVGGRLVPANLVSPTLLAAAFTLHDELGRPYGTDQALFVPRAPGRPADVADGALDLGKGDLTPGDACRVPGLPPQPGEAGCVSSRVELDRNANVLSVLQDDGDAITTLYDGLDRPIVVRDAEGNRVQYAYDAEGNTIEVSEAEVSQVDGVSGETRLTTFFYDALNRPVRSIDNLGHTTEQRHDSFDQVRSRSDARGPGGGVIQRRAFAAGRRTANQINQPGNIERLFYDGLGRLVRTEALLTASGLGNGSLGVTEEGIDAPRPPPDPTQAGDGLITTRFGYDRNGLLISLIDDNENFSGFAYDDLDRLVRESKGNPPIIRQHGYDLDGNRTETTDENGTRRGCVFDAANRLRGCVFDPAEGVRGTLEQVFEYDGLGRDTRTIDRDPEGDLESALTFDSLGRTLEEAQSARGMTRLIGHGWRAENLRHRLTYPGGRVVEASFDSLDRLTEVGDPNGRLPRDARFEYTGPRLSVLRFGSGSHVTSITDALGTEDAGHDGIGRPVERHHRTPDLDALLGFREGWDRGHARTLQARQHAPQDSETYALDSLGRLRTHARGVLEGDRIPAPGPRPPTQQRWTLDGLGNWTAVDAEARQHSATNEVTRRVRGGRPTDLVYDDAGNLLRDGTRQYTWDALHRLREVRDLQGNLLGSYRYDAQNRRRVAVAGGVTTEYVYSGWNVLEEHENGRLARQYVHGDALDQPHALDRDTNADGVVDQRLYDHRDVLGSVVALTDEDGLLVEAYQYDAYGRPTVFTHPGDDRRWFTADDITGQQSAVGNTLMFTSQRWDAGTGLYHFKRRYLDPELGRFISRDPMGYADGPNVYEYAGSRPGSATDPLGLGGGGLMDSFWGPVDPFKLDDRLEDRLVTLPPWHGLDEQGRLIKRPLVLPDWTYPDFVDRFHPTSSPLVCFSKSTGV